MSEVKNKNKSTDLEDIKSDFITVASHQLRTPISAIRWSLDTLLSEKPGQLNVKQIGIIQEAYQSNKFMVKIVNDLLRVARFEEKGITLNPQKYNLAIFLKKILKKHEDLSRAMNTSIELKILTKDTKAYFDALNMEMVLDSIIDNAISYGKGKGAVEITIEKTNHHLLLKIKDNGIGIPKDQQHLVFSKFFRAENAMKTQTEGLGLELYLAKKIIEGLGGKIDFTSKEGQGTTFNIYLPTAKQDFDGVISIYGEKKAEPENILKKEREFVSITVHELKAPLGISKWSLEMLKSQKPGKLNETQLELIDQVYHGNERLLVLVRDLLNLSKLQEGKFEISLKNIQFEDVISEIVTGFKIQAEKKGQKLVFKKSTKKLPLVLADAARVGQVATNLISNAIKYTPEKGSVTVAINFKTGKQLQRISDVLSTANLEFTSNSKGYLVLAVHDTGIGISDKDKSKMFSKFFRSKKVLDSETEGTGLGLYITKSIVNLHKGDIWFTSELGKGSTFYFSLPIA